MKKLVLFALFALFAFAACGSDTPVPGYPFPVSPPLEETDLAMYLDTTAGDEEEVVEEEWDDGMGDAADTPAADATEAAPEPAAEAPAEPAPVEPAPAPARRRAR